MMVAGDNQVPHNAPDEPLPEWLIEELVELAEAFDHLPQRARHDAMKRNMSQRAWDEFDARAERHVRGQGEGEREGPF